MELSSTLLREFAKITDDRPEVKKEDIAYGTVVEQGGKIYVQLDGSDILTPVEKAMDAITGDRVVVMIKNHQAVITGNITSPASARKNTYIKTIDDTLLLYGLDAVGIRSETEVGNDIYRAEVIVNTEDADDPLVQIQTYKVGDNTKQNILRVSLDNGTFLNGGEVMAANNYYRTGSATLNGSLVSTTNREYTVSFGNIPTGYKLVGIFTPSIKDSDNHDSEITILGVSYTSNNQVKINVANYELYTVNFTITLTWLALKVSSTSDTGNEIINLPT